MQLSLDCDSRRRLIKPSRKFPQGKSIGLDGFHHIFISSLLESGLRGGMEVNQGFHNTLSVLPTLNATFLTLIPKEESVSHPKQFHPDCIVQCHLQDYHKGNFPLAQTPSFFHYLS
jgi:hypothetical protein